MNSITQDMKFRLSLINYSKKFGVTKAAIKYKTNRQYIYRWLKRYDGTLDSLADKSRRPHSHPNQHTPDEIKLISDMRKRINMKCCFFELCLSKEAILSLFNHYISSLEKAL